MHREPTSRSRAAPTKLVNTIIVNTKGEGQQASEDFWVKAEKLYYTALIAYIWYEAPEEEQNFSMLIDLVDASEAREDDENFKNEVDLLFNELVLSDKLFEHCAEIDEAARNRMELIVRSLAEQNGVTEQLKAENQMEWVRQMNACKAQAEEVVKAELIYD